MIGWTDGTTGGALGTGAKMRGVGRDLCLFSPETGKDYRMLCSKQL